MGTSSKHISRRMALSLIGFGAGASLIAACSSPSSNPPAAAPTTTTSGSAPTSAATSATGSSTASTPSASQQPKRGGRLRWAQVGDIVTTDAVLSSPASNETTGEVAEALTAYDDKLNPIPRLAESWEWSSDNTRIKINLRKGVTFHSGREFTSDDVKYNILRVRDPSNGFAAVVAPGSNWWTGIDTPDKNTIVLTSDKPRPGVFDWLQYLRIQDKDVLEGSNANSTVGGTGPFKWVEWVQGDHILMQRNTNYWDSNLPYVDEYFVQIYRDQQSMIAALESGGLDVAALAPIPDAVRLKDDPNYQVISTNDVGQYFYACVNTGVAPTDNAQLRQAIGYAINRQRFTDSVMRGFVGAPKDLPWTTTSPAYEPTKNTFYTYDLDKAKSLVSQSGVSNPEFDISWATAGFSAEYQQLAQIIQSDLAQIGIKTNLKPLEPAQFTAVGLGQNPSYNGMRLSAGAYAQLAEAASEFVLSRTMGTASNQSGYYDDQFTSLVNQATTEPDAGKRKQLYSQINDKLLDSAYCYTVSAYANLMAVRGNVRNMRWEPSTFVTVREMWLA
jgi:peptide/nickel transport system substrate-binding protein